MNHSFTSDSASKASNLSDPGSELGDSVDAFIAKTSDGAATAVDQALDTAKGMTATIKPAIDRMLDSGGVLAKDAAAATREAADKARRSASRAVASAETYVSEQPMRCVLIAAAVGAALATLILKTSSRRAVQ